MPTILGPITPAGEGYPAVEDTLIAGGHKVVADTTARDAIPDSRRKAGMTVFCQSDTKSYRLTGEAGAWVWAEESYGAGTTRVTITQSGHTLSAEDVVYVNGAGTYALAQADDEATSRCAGVVESVDGENFVLVTAGLVNLIGKTPGATYYLSPTTPGLMAASEPAEGFFRVPVVRAISATQGIVLLTEPLEVVNDLLATSSIESAASVTIPMTEGFSYHTLDLSHNPTFAATSHAPGSQRRIRVSAGAAERTLGFSADWQWASNQPLTLESGCVALLTLTCCGSSDSDVLAHWTPLESPDSLTLLVHDAFSGEAGSVDGRTPDTLNTPGNNWAKLSATSPTVADGVAVLQNTSASVECGVANVRVECSVTLPATADAGTGIILRVGDVNNYLSVLAITGYGIVLRKAVAGVGTEVAKGGNVASLTAGSSHALAVRAVGSHITVYHGGQPVLSAKVDEFVSNTKHGFAGRNTSGDDRTVDNWKCSAIAYSREFVAQVQDILERRTLTSDDEVPLTLGPGFGALTLALDHDSNFRGAGHALGAERQILISTGASAHAVGFPMAWKWSGGKPDSLAANSSALLTLRCYGTTESDVLARWDTVAPESGTLLVHDAFSGEAGSVDGRTPDTLNTPGNNWAKLTATSPTVADGVAVLQNTSASVECGVSDVVVEADITLPTTADAGTGILLRVGDANNYLSVLAVIGYGITLRRVVSGTGEEVASGGDASLMVAGSSHHLKARAKGNTVTVYLDDVPVVSALVSDGASNTKHGFGGRNTSAESRTVDNWKCYSLS